jgi:hypothetical protein
MFRHSLPVTVLPIALLCLVLLEIPVPAQTPPEAAAPDTSAIQAADDHAVPDLDHYMVRRNLECEDVSLNCFRILPDLFYEDKPDSVFAFLDFWADHCGHSEPIVRTEILAHIWEGNFSEDLYGKRILDDLLWFRLKLSDVRSDWTTHYWRYEAYDASEAEQLDALVDYDEFIADLADQLRPATKPGSLEHLFCLFYMGEPDSLLLGIREDRNRDTKLRRYYDEEVARLRRVSDLDIAVTFGSWQPTRKLEVVGNHFALGALLGLSGKRWIGRVAGEVRLGKSSNYYSVRRAGDPESTLEYLGVYGGVEAGMRLWRSRHHAVDLLVGVGYDGIRALLPNEDRLAEEGDTEYEGDWWLNTVNRNATLGYRYFFGPNSNTQIGLEVRYEVAGYETGGGGTDLDGEAWNYRLVVGWSGDRWRNRRLTGLRADRWD